jgi:8-oxo-dGTP diphosphatase
MKTLQIASAIIRHDNQILMIQQPDQNGLYWFIPGGVVETGELIGEALKREVMEETGLTIQKDIQLAFITQTIARYQSRQFTAFIFEVASFSGDLYINDPDGLIHGAEFVPIGECLQRLKRVQWDSMRDPLVTYLKGEVKQGKIWQYHQYSYHHFELVQRI